MYDNVPNKKRRVVVDESGNLEAVGKPYGTAHNLFMPGSGTLHTDGTLTVTGTQFKWDSYIVCSYEAGSAGTAPMAVQRLNGSAHFTGDADTGFFYFVINPV